MRKIKPFFFICSILLILSISDSVFAQNNSSEIETNEKTQDKLESIQKSIEGLSDDLMATNTALWVTANITTLISISLAIIGICTTISLTFRGIPQRKIALSWIGVGITLGALIALLVMTLNNGKINPDWGLIFGGITASGVFVSVIIFSIQIWQKKKIESADFTLRLIKKIYDDNRKMISLINFNEENPFNVKLYNPIVLDRFLGELETVAMYTRDGIVNKKYAYEMFSTIITSVHNDTQIQEFLNRERKKDQEMYSNIVWLEENITKWNHY